MVRVKEKGSVAAKIIDLGLANEIEGAKVVVSLTAEEVTESLEQTTNDSELLEACYEFRKEEFA